jgi:hypothetical protein
MSSKSWGIMGEFYALSRLEVEKLNRKGRKERPQRSQRNTGGVVSFASFAVKLFWPR